MKYFFLTLFFSFLILHSSLFSQSLFPVRDKGETRDRTYDVLHYKIEVSFDEPQKKVIGKVTTTLVPFLDNFTTIEFDAERLHIRKVTMGMKSLLFDSLTKTIRIHLDKSYSFNDTLVVSVEYDAIPKKGMYFIQPDSAYPNKPHQIWTQGEDMDNHFWFPCYDFPNDKATSEVLATVQSKYEVLSNGKLVSVKENKKQKTKTFHWSQAKPHSSYLIMLAVGEYAILKEKVGSPSIEYYVYKNQTDDAWKCLYQTPDMMKFFNEKIGFVYPWEKYAQVCIHEFMFGGMENTSATTMADDRLVYDARVRIDGLPTGLIAHELAHQWWGDVVTCKDWRHLWLNESFASYFSPLYTEYSKGRDEFDYQMYNSQQAGINIDTSVGRKPIVSVGSYTTNVYPRGASVLHMLRFFLGDKLFWKSLNHYITKHQFTAVETNDLKLAIEEATGLNLYWFFDEWVYKAGHPIFNVSYTWSDSAKAIYLSVRQTQTMDSLTGVFRMPVDVEVTTTSGSTTARIQINSQDSTYTISSTEKPKLVIFDKGNFLLKELKFDKSVDEWKEQAQFATNPIDRMRALQQLGNDTNNTNYVSLFSTIALKDKFWSVRNEAVTSLGKVKSENVIIKQQISDALISVYADEKSTVRANTISQLGKFRGEKVSAALHSALHDSSYSVEENALRSLAKIDSINVIPLLVAYVDTPSYRSRISTTALSLLSTLDSAKALSIAFSKIPYGVPKWERSTALNILSKYGKKRDDVKDIFTSLLNDKNRDVRFTAIRALGDIGDENILSFLEHIANDSEDVASETAKNSIEKIKKRAEK
ncbi:MAG: HEAT repeat domain-containing protein [Ignavibacteriales bacterium]|nr:HEAT repeat domain-containing protein [Ignavibacteriales bacterium]